MIIMSIASMALDNERNLGPSICNSGTYVVLTWKLITAQTAK